MGMRIPALEIKMMLESNPLLLTRALRDAALQRPFITMTSLIIYCIITIITIVIIVIIIVIIIIIIIS